MNTYISILRGINVSGHKMIKMDALRKLYETLGFKNVRTYIQSGNVIFESKPAKHAELEKKIAQKIRADFGFEVPVLVRTHDEMEAVIQNNPFLKKRNEDPAKLHVTFLSAAPNAAIIADIQKGSWASDQFSVRDTHVYLFCPDGYGNTKLHTNFFESKLKLTATTRNWKTILELTRMAGEKA
jgi:uncharacterized protein (DUF1697 family)